MRQVGERDHFHRAVHVTIGDRHDPHRHATADDLHGIGIVAGRFAHRTKLHRDFISQCQPLQFPQHHRVHIRTPPEDRTQPEVDLPVLLHVQSRTVGRMSDVDRDPQVGLDRKRTRLCPAQADLFLHGRDGIDGGPRISCRDKFQRLHHCPDADAIIHPRCCGQTVPHLAEAEIERDRISHRDDLLCIGLILRTDIDPQIADLRHFLPLVLGLQVNRFSGDDALHRTLRAPDLHVLAQQDLHIPAADRLGPQKAGLVDMLNDQADLIAVPGQHDPR